MFKYIGYGQDSKQKWRYYFCLLLCLVKKALVSVKLQRLTPVSLTK